MGVRSPDEYVRTRDPIWSAALELAMEHGRFTTNEVVERVDTTPTTTRRTLLAMEALGWLDHFRNSSLWAAGEKLGGDD